MAIGTEGDITRIGGLPSANLEPFLLPMALASDAVAKDGELVGDPTEGALVVLAAKGGIDATTTREEYPRVATLPFDAAYKLMATFHRMQDEAWPRRDPLLCQGRARPTARPRRLRARRRAACGGAGGRAREVPGLQ